MKAFKKVFILGLSITGCSILEHVLRYFSDTVQIFCVDDFISKEEFVRRVVSHCSLEERIIFLNSVQASNIVENMVQGETDEVIVFCSPGIPMNNTLVTACKAHGITLSCDFDLLYATLLENGISFHDGDDIAVFITGTVGKSTTASGIASELKREENGQNLAVILSGNIGIPVLSIYDDIIVAKRLQKKVVCIFELSSAQLELLNEFVPTISVCLTVCVDHLDRYNSMEEYLYYKSKIFCHSKKYKPIHNILCVDSEYSQYILENVKKFYNTKSVALGYKDRANEWSELSTMYEGSEFIPFSTKDISRGVTFSKGILNVNLENHNCYKIETGEIAVIPEENIGIIALLTFLIVGIPNMQMDLQTLPHCLERCYSKAPKYESVKFINNSKATKQAAVEYSLSLYKNVLLIIGGKSKGEKLTEILPKFHNINAIFLIGETTDRFAYEIEMSATLLKYYKCYTLDVAMRSIKNVLDESVMEDYTVLLSPMCSSLDQWKNFQERGMFFKNFIIDHY
ncbi:Mur ligase family protein [Candidatus Fokinia crypta]|uniref:UDP-N-acetylmuramoylalanine--D-glutamate ligase n=1 Tax=Candidatus Fokinia crypta TaxID=1920990 RepID=A0ABZ0UNF6_9RICK|nr:Mur ligase family protein [Candidatus Fokinia cryptica]WPX97661.1 UDP-N-acetylmuramoylalanine--D-glutamate ligase [Candidatus Fokinia cryptica]